MSNPIRQEREIKQIYDRYQKEFRFTGAGDIIEGYIHDEEGNPIPGVTVLVKGTTYGTISNLDGYYSLMSRGEKILLHSHLLAINRKRLTSRIRKP